MNILSPLILVVEDDDAAHNIIATTLTAAGYKVLLSRTIEAAAYTITQEQVEGAVLDQEIAHKSAFDFVQLLKKEQRNFPMILISDDQSTDLLTRARDNGFDQIVKKPFDPARLVHMMGNAMRRA